MKTYNIGFESLVGPIGFIVDAPSGGEAEFIARKRATEFSYVPKPGVFQQRRDTRPEANNVYFDETYTFVERI